MKAHVEIKVRLHAFLTLLLGNVERGGSCLGRSTPSETAPLTLRGWVALELVWILWRRDQLLYSACNRITSPGPSRPYDSLYADSTTLGKVLGLQGIISQSSCSVFVLWLP